MSIGLLLALALGAQTDGPTAAAAPVAAPAATVQTADRRNERNTATGDLNRRVCRSQGATGSRLAGAKICKTAREWEEQRVAAKEELDRHQRPDGTNGR